MTDYYYESARSGESPFSDFLWYGIDQCGHIAVLITAGYGRIPLKVFNRELYRNTDHYFENCTPLSHANTRILLLDVLPEEEVRKYLNLGLYIYDYSPDNNQYDVLYRIIGMPKAPLHLNALPHEMQEYLRDIIILNGCYETFQELDVSKCGLALNILESL